MRSPPTDSRTVDYRRGMGLIREGTAIGCREANPHAETDELTGRLGNNLKVVQMAVVLRIVRYQRRREDQRR